MLSKVADFYEREVDDAVSALSSLIEPIMIVFLGWLSARLWWQCITIFKLRSGGIGAQLQATLLAGALAVPGFAPAFSAHSSAVFNVVIYRLPVMMERAWQDDLPKRKARGRLRAKRFIWSPHARVGNAGTPSLRSKIFQSFPAGPARRCCCLRDPHQRPLPTGRSGDRRTVRCRCAWRWVYLSGAMAMTFLCECWSP